MLLHGYLSQYGYLPETDSGVGNLLMADQLEDAIKQLQKFGNIPATGVLDAATKKLMRSPRCGIPDVASGHHARRKRYVLQGQTWPRTNLTWSLKWNNNPNLDYHRVKDALLRALNVWSDNSGVVFEDNHSTNADADILISFERGDHNDRWSFDGRGHVLAHAFFPGTGAGGDAHFDEDEQWSLDDEGSEGTSLFAVAAHEFGHSLGISHSEVKGALMFPWYQGKLPNFRLPEDDRDAIQKLYGPKRRTYTRYNPAPTEPTRRTSIPYNRPRYSPPAQPPATQPPPKVPKSQPKDSEKKPDTCDTSYDAISIIRGELFIFKDKYFWRIGENGLYQDYPHLTRLMWNALPESLTHVDAVYERFDGKNVFFIGRQVYMFTGITLIYGFPRPLTALGLPAWLDHIDAVMVWGHNSKTYFFSGGLYWRFDEEIQRVELDYPRNISIWRGISPNIDAAFQWKDGATYFFKGKGFWKFNDERFRVYDARQTPSAQFWMKCPSDPRYPHQVQSMQEVNDVHINAIKEISFYTAYKYHILFLTIIIALVSAISVVVIIKRRNNNPYERPKLIGIDR